MAKSKHPVVLRLRFLLATLFQHPLPTQVLLRLPTLVRRQVLLRPLCPSCRSQTARSKLLPALLLQLRLPRLRLQALLQALLQLQLRVPG